MNCAFLDVIKLSARTGKIPREIPEHYLTWVRAEWNKSRGRTKPAPKYQHRPLVIHLPRTAAPV